MTLFLTGAVLGFSAAAQPGPFQAYLLAQSAKNGAARTMPVALVPFVSDPIVIAVVLAVLAQLSTDLLRALQIVGGAVVLWLAAATLRAVRGGAATAETGTAPRGVLRAALVNLTNPNAWIFWSVVGGPVLASAWKEHPPRAFLFLAGFYVFLTGGNAALVLLAGAARRLGPSFGRGLGVVSGLALLAFGLVQIGRGVAGA